MENKILNIGILYLGLHNQLIKKYGVNGNISRKEFFCKLGKHGQIPRQLRHLIINEMCDKNLIKKVDRDNIQVLKFDIDIEKEYNKLYELAGIF